MITFCHLDANTKTIITTSMLINRWQTGHLHHVDFAEALYIYNGIE